MNTLKDWLVRACAELGLQIETEFVWVTSDGRTLQPVVRIRELGGPNGMLIFENYDDVRLCTDEVVRAGYGYSVLDEPRHDEKYDLASFREMFSDWGLNI